MGSSVSFFFYFEMLLVRSRQDFEPQKPNSQLQTPNPELQPPRPQNMFSATSLIFLVEVLQGPVLKIEKYLESKVSNFLEIF